LHSSVGETGITLDQEVVEAADRRRLGSYP
jgi:hypothetical protein